MFSFLKNNLIILIIILILFSYLGIKAFNPDGWDGWGFGSAQTLMSTQYWVRDGLIKNYFLFIPSPYSKVIHYLDTPEFINRPIEKWGGDMNGARHRIYYTHYPPLYLAPFAILAKIGITDRSIFRILALIISLCGLGFFYWFIKLVSNKTLAVIAALYYGFSVTFLNYADSISIQPFTIFLTFLILVLSVLAGRLPAQRRYNLAIWLAYFTLSLSSYDATFFIFAWLILYDAIVLKKFLWRKWLFWASAPILGFALQIIQNTWYLGWADAMRDIYVSYTGRAIGSLKNFILGLIAPFVSMTSIKTIFIFRKTIVASISAVSILGILWKFRQRIGLNFDYFKIIFVLAIAAIIQPFFINITGLWPYQGVLTAPFWGLLIGASSIFIADALRKRKSDIYRTLFFGILTVAVLIIWSAQFYGTWFYVKDWPNNRPDQKIINFSKTIKSIEPGKEKVAFRILPKNPIWRSQFPTFSFEYYLGMLKIDFANRYDFLTDFWWLRKTSQYPYYSFVISEDKKEAESLRSEIKKTLKNSVSEIKNIQGQYLFTVGPK